MVNDTEKDDQLTDLRTRIREEKGTLHHLVQQCLGAVELGRGRGEYQLTHSSHTYCESRDYCPLQEDRKAQPGGEKPLPYCLASQLHNPDQRNPKKLDQQYFPESQLGFYVGRPWRTSRKPKHNL